MAKTAPSAEKTIPQFHRMAPGNLQMAMYPDRMDDISETMLAVDAAVMK